MIGDDMVILYKVDTNFKNYPFKTMIYNHFFSEWG